MPHFSVLIPNGLEAGRNPLTQRCRKIRNGQPRPGEPSKMTVQVSCDPTIGVYGPTLLRQHLCRSAHRRHRAGRRRRVTTIWCGEMRAGASCRPVHPEVRTHRIPAHGPIQVQAERKQRHRLDPHSSPRSPSRRCRESLRPAAHRCRRNIRDGAPCRNRSEWRPQVGAAPQRAGLVSKRGKIRVGPNGPTREMGALYLRNRLRNACYRIGCANKQGFLDDWQRSTKGRSNATNN